MPALIALNAVRDSWGAAFLWLSSLGPPLTLSPCHVAAGQGPRGEAAGEPEGATSRPKAPPAAFATRVTREWGQLAEPRGWTGR